MGAIGGTVARGTKARWAPEDVRGRRVGGEAEVPYLQAAAQSVGVLQQPLELFVVGARQQRLVRGDLALQALPRRGDAGTRQGAKTSGGERTRVRTHGGWGSCGDGHCIVANTWLRDMRCGGA